MARRWGWLLALQLLLGAGCAAAVAAAPDGGGGSGACPAGLEAEEVLRKLNTLRASARSCGTLALPAAATLRWDARLVASSQRYAQELARRDSLSHEGQQSRSLRERLSGAGYRMRLAGENLAAGPETLDEALAQWLSSPDHCDNLMAADFEDVGLACVAAGGGRYERFWVLHLGRSAAH